MQLLHLISELLLSSVSFGFLQLKHMNTALIEQHATEPTVTSRSVFISSSSVIVKASDVTNFVLDVVDSCNSPCKEKLIQRTYFVYESFNKQVFSCNAFAIEFS